MKRIANKFAELKKQKRCAFITYICAGDPDYETSLQVLKSLPKNGADIIEIGAPFLDPSGDGPIIEDAAKRAINNGMTLKKTFKMANEFRKSDKTTPIVLMSYYNPILHYGLDKIFIDAQKSGIDGILIVDLPLEEENEILPKIKETNLDLIKLIAPPTTQSRAKLIAKNASGFLYLVSMLGITGTKLANSKDNQDNLKKLRAISKLPIAIGFGIKTPKQARDFAKIGPDGVVVGSRIVNEINEAVLQKKSSDQIVKSVSKTVSEFKIINNGK